MALSGIRLPIASQDQVTLYREMFANNFLVKAGVMESKLLNTVTIENIDPGAEYLLVDAVEQHSSSDSNTMAAATSRIGSTSYSNTKFAKRQIDSNLFKYFEKIRSGDLKSRLVSPTSKIIMMTLAESKRALDSAILSASVGTACEKYYDASGVRQTASKTFDTDMVIADTESKGFTWERFLQITKTFRNAGVDVDNEEIFLVIGPQQEAEAKEDDRFISSLYTGDHIIRSSGNIQKTNGISIIVSNELSESSNIRDCIAYTRIGMCLAIEEEWEVTLELATELEHNYSLGIKRAYGASRMDEKRVIKFQCYEGGSMTA
jgi:hypothetical protein